MHSPLHEAEQGLTAEIRYMNNLQTRNEEDLMSISSPTSMDQNPWTLLTTHFRASTLEGREAIPCCVCEARTANAIFFNCHHVVVCNLCAADVEFCPLIHCAAAVITFMRII
ncbi:uncharacterized protein LOC112566328 [Pomacea canaliculata]|uniref:uncharacterized protein LOC112566328 n=1 Tax=Pomacea canaliculata TaxID=400727 RepID=UPI000D73CBAE|nr:uncharacterized protein LOC112566328 [Pomacea canaliculata]